MLIKKSRKAICFSTILLLFIVQSIAQSYTAKGVVSADIYNDLLADGNAVHLFSSEDTIPQLFPNTELAKDATSKVFGNFSDKMGFAMEKVYLLPKETLVKNSTSNSKDVDTSIEKASIVIRSISKMQGMEYVSSSQKIETLYKNAYRIEKAESNSEVEDLTKGNADGMSLFALLDDNSFGKMKYRIDYRQSSNEIFMVLTNVNSIGWGMFKYVKPGDMKMCLSVVDCGSSYIVYIGFYSDFEKVSVMEKRMKRSFSARVDAIYKWFTYQF